MKSTRVVVIFFKLLLCSRITQSANILAVFAYTFGTPYMVVKPYIKALIAKGHNITVISSVRFLPDIEGVRHIRVPKLDQAIDGKYIYLLATRRDVPNMWEDYLWVKLVKFICNIQFSYQCYSLTIRTFRYNEL